MENVTVKKLIEILSKKNMNDIVCSVEIGDDDKSIYSALEICRAYEKAEYINDDGDSVIGNIVVLF